MSLPEPCTWEVIIGTIILFLKGLTVTNTLAYYSTELVIITRRFYTTDPCA
jgi:hypothetical protein